MLIDFAATQCFHESGCRSPTQRISLEQQLNMDKDPIIQKATGKTDPVEVMARLREMKNSFK